MKEKIGGFVEKFGKFAPIAAGVVILLSVIVGAVSDSIWILACRGSLLNLNFLGGFLVILAAATCAATYFEKRVAFGAAGAFAILSLTDFFSIFERLINVIKNIIEGWFNFSYFLSIVVYTLCDILSFVGFAAMAALIVMVIIKSDFKFLKFWYAPAGVVLVANLISFVYSFFNVFSGLEHYRWVMGSHLMAIFLHILCSLISLVSIVLVPLGMALYAKYVYGNTETAQIDGELF